MESWRTLAYSDIQTTSVSQPKKDTASSSAHKQYETVNAINHTSDQDGEDYMLIIIIGAVIVLFLVVAGILLWSCGNKLFFTK